MTNPPGGHMSGNDDKERLHALLGRVRDYLLDRCRVPRGTGLVVALSGGADSVLLLRALVALQDWPVVAAVFVDHGLRDVSQEREVAERTATVVGVPFHATSVTVPDGGNLQAGARQARYAVLETTAAKFDALLATGHTMTDQAETVLTRAVRGAGLRGLAAIRPRNGVRVRPLLNVERHEARAFQWSYVDDPTNDSDAYLRNRLRRNVMPLLSQENPQVIAALAHLAEAAAAEMALLERLVSHIDTGASMAEEAPSIVEALLHWRLAQEVPVGVHASRNAVRDLALAASNGRSVRVSLGSGVAGVSRFGVVTFEGDVDPRRSLVAPAPGVVRGRLGVLAVGCRPETANSDVKRSGAEFSNSIGNSKFEKTLWLDPMYLTWPLTLRAWRLGDERGTAGVWSLLDGAGRTLWSSASPDYENAQKRTSRNSLFTYLCVIGH